MSDVEAMSNRPKSLFTTKTTMSSCPAMEEAQFTLSLFKESLAKYYPDDERLEAVRLESSGIERKLNRLVPHSKRLDAYIAMHDVFSRYLVRVQKNPKLLTKKALLKATNMPQVDAHLALTEKS